MTESFKHFLRPLHIDTLMRKHLSTLTFQVVERQKSLYTAVTRIQYGFQPIENAVEASRHIRDISNLLREIEESIRVYSPPEGAAPVSTDFKSNPKSSAINLGS